MTNETINEAAERIAKELFNKRRSVYSFEHQVASDVTKRFKEIILNDPFIQSLLVAQKEADEFYKELVEVGKFLDSANVPSHNDGMPYSTIHRLNLFRTAIAQAKEGL